MKRRLQLFSFCVARHKFMCILIQANVKCGLWKRKELCDLMFCVMYSLIAYPHYCNARSFSHTPVLLSCLAHYFNIDFLIPIVPSRHPPQSSLYISLLPARRGAQLSCNPQNPYPLSAASSLGNTHVYNEWLVSSYSPYPVITAETAFTSQRSKGFRQPQHPKTIIVHSK